MSTEPTQIATDTRDPARRSVRTGVQVFTVQALIQLYNAFAPVDLTAEQTTILTILGTPLLSYIQNFLEEKGFIPEMVKGDPNADLNARKIEALAVSAGEQDDRLERLEEAARRGSGPAPPTDTMPPPPPERG